MPEQRLAIFDIDGTLVPGASSEVRFVRYLWAQRALGPRQLAAYGWFCLRYWPRYGRDLLQKNKAWLSGLDKRRVRALADAFVQEALLPVLYEPVLQRLRTHQQTGSRIVLLSGTPQFLADALADAVGADGAYGALCSARNHVYRAAPPLRHPYAATKIEGAQYLADMFGISLADAVAYGDSLHDAHLFRVVGEAVVVQPDSELVAVAAGEGWEVLPS